MRGVREHVDHARCRAAIAGLVHQQPGIARQRRRVAADVDDAARRPSSPARGCAHAARPAPWPARRRLRAADRPATCRPRQAPPDRRRRARTGCAPRSACSRGQAIRGAALSRARATRTSLPSMPSTSRGRVASGRREVAQAAEPVDHLLVGLHLEQTQRARHQHAVDVRVDLREVGRPERHRECRTRASA